MIIAVQVNPNVQKSPFQWNKDNDWYNERIFTVSRYGRASNENHWSDKWNELRGLFEKCAIKGIICPFEVADLFKDDLSPTNYIRLEEAIRVAFTTGMYGASDLLECMNILYGGDWQVRKCSHISDIGFTVYDQTVWSDTHLDIYQRDILNNGIDFKIYHVDDYSPSCELSENDYIDDFYTFEATAKEEIAEEYNISTEDVIIVPFE